MSTSSTSGPAFLRVLLSNGTPAALRERFAQMYLSHVQRHIKAAGIDAVIVPSADPHNSEYVATMFQRRAGLTNFHGSAGTAIVTAAVPSFAGVSGASAALWLDAAKATATTNTSSAAAPPACFLFTDGRYWLEAATALPKQADTGAPLWTLMRAGAPNVPDIEEFLGRASDAFTEAAASAGATPPKSASLRVGMDPLTANVKTWEAYAKKVSMEPTDVAGRALDDAAAEAAADASFSDCIRRMGSGCEVGAANATATQRLPAVIMRADAESGESVPSKVKRLCAALRAQRCDATVLTALDDIAWLTNLRGTADVAFNPVFISYALVDAVKGTVTVFATDANLAAVREPNRIRIAETTSGTEKEVSVVADIAVESFMAARKGKKTNPSDAASGVGECSLCSIEALFRDHYNICFAPYDTLQAHLSTHLKPGMTVAVDEAQASFGLVEFLQKAPSGEQEESTSTTAGGVGATCKRMPAIVQKLKGNKNPAELQGFIACHRRDGCALTRYLAWLYDTLCPTAAKISASSSPSTSSSSSPPAHITEASAAAYLEQLRSEEDGFVCPSFNTISGAGPNGAVIHYSAPEDDPITKKQLCRDITAGDLYLVDSGGQYTDGTTDVTRVLSFGAPTPAQREAYTAVLKGHIALDAAVFPRGITGHRLDSFARQPLWALGLDYAHGTGHGVGSFLNVHEGPHGIHSRQPERIVPLEPNMVVSNEPGYYEDGAFGIRIENLVYVCEAGTDRVKYPRNTTTTTPAMQGPLKRTLQNNSDFHDTANKYTSTSAISLSQCFKWLTLVPLHPELIDVALLTPSERAWVDEYHAAVREALEPGITATGDQRALHYLRLWTRPLQ